MSMLAERKQKQKWILNRNTSKHNNWSKDSNKFGQKMLERMGWSEGKGLGKREDGQTEHVKVAYKNNQKGIGFKDSVEWSLQQDNFNALLEELSGPADDIECQLPVKSLEEKSQNSRARVHYKKFTRGKDLSRYSKKDLANIFGKKKLTNGAVDSKSSIEKKTPPNSLLIVNGGSMVDYFKHKNPVCTKAKSDLSESDIEQPRCGFGFIDSTTADSAHRKDKKSKSKTFKHTFVSYLAAEGENEEKPEETKAVKKRKSKSQDNAAPCKKKLKLKESPNAKVKDECALGLVNRAFDPLNNNIVVMKEVLETIPEGDVENSIEEDFSGRGGTETIDSYENQDLKVKKKKKKQKQLEGLDNAALNLNGLEEDFSGRGGTESIDSYEHQDLKVKKKKKKQKQLEGLDNAALNLNVCGYANTEEEVAPAFEVKRKKSKTKKNDNISGVDNVGLVLTDLEDSFEASKPMKKKKKCKNSDLDNSNHSCKGINNAALDVSSDADLQVQNSFEVKKVKKKMKGLDNPALNVSSSSESGEVDSGYNTENAKVTVKKEPEVAQEGNDQSRVEEVDCDIMLNVTDEPVKENPIPNKAKRKSVHFSKRNQEFVISEESAEDVAKRNELFDINTKVIQNGLRESKKKGRGLLASTFDEATINRLCDSRLGVDNGGFDARMQQVEESVSLLTKSIDNCQAEIENNINESKLAKVPVQEDFMVGEINSGSDGPNERHEEGVTLRFKHASFSRNQPLWARKNDVMTSWPKKSYKHLIRGDIVVKFKDSNLHEIAGYGVKHK